MRLLGMPTTKANVMIRAAKESWDYIESPGPGGVRRLYKLPAKYGESVPPHAEPVAGTIAGGTAEVDLRKLELAIKALEEVEERQGVRIAAERRPAVIAVLYQFLVKSESQGTEALDVVLRALV